MTIVKSFIIIYAYLYRLNTANIFPINEVCIQNSMEVTLLITYEPFWNTIKAKGITTYTLINKYNISSATIDRMKKGKGISTMKIDDFCRILNCKVEDIILYIPD